MQRFLFSLLIVIYWGVGFAPFRWAPPVLLHDNGVQETEQGQLMFPRPGIAYTKASPAWVRAAIEDMAFAVELEVLTANAWQDGPARIFTLSRDPSSRNLTIGQAKEDLVVRLRTPTTGSNGVPAHYVRGVFRTLGPHRIVVRVSPEDIRIEVNGQQKLLAPLPRMALSNWEQTYRLAFGNELTFERPWQGQVRKAVVHVRGEAFHYTAAALQKPARYIVVSKHLQRLRYELVPFTSDATLVTKATDAVVNVLGFVPFGFLLAFGRRKRLSPAAVFVWCAALSLSIEIGQLCFEQRYPSTTDLLCNTLGGMIGAWVGHRLQLRRFGYTIDTSGQSPL